MHAARSNAEMSTIMHLARVPGKELPQEVPLKPIPVCPPPAVADLHDAHSHPGFTRRQHSVHVENPPVPCDAFVLQQIVHALLRSSEQNRSSHLQPELTPKHVLTDLFGSGDFPAEIIDPEHAAEIVIQRLNDAGFKIESAERYRT